MNALGNYRADCLSNTEVKVNPIEFIQINWQLMSDIAGYDEMFDLATLPTELPPTFKHEFRAGGLVIYKGYRHKYEVALDVTRFIDKCSHFLQKYGVIVPFLWTISCCILRESLFLNEVIARDQRLDLNDARKGGMDKKFLDDLMKSPDLPVNDTRYHVKVDSSIINKAVCTYVYKLGLTEELDAGRIRQLIHLQKDEIEVGILD